MVVENLSVSVGIVFPGGTTIYLCQEGHTTHLQWVIQALQLHLKDADGTTRCVFPLALAMNQWVECRDVTQITESALPADLEIVFDFRHDTVSTVYKKERILVKMSWWLGTNPDELPFVEAWGPTEEDDTFEDDCLTLNEEIA
jgi:hypothetical protein